MAAWLVLRDGVLLATGELLALPAPGLGDSGVESVMSKSGQ